MHIKKHLQIIIILLSFISQSCKQHKLSMTDEDSFDHSTQLTSDDYSYSYSYSDSDSDDEIAQPFPITQDKPFVSFDFAIKSLLRDNGDYEILESFISAILQAHGYPAIKIDQLLEKESSKESKHKKYSLIDIVVQDASNNKYLVEIERNRKNCFIHKTVFNTSRRIVDHLGVSKSYTNIEKIFHIDLLYFKVGNKPVYHGKTIFKALGEETSSHVKLRVKKEDIIDINRMCLVDADDILPEYFIISIPNFSKKEDLKDYLEEWLYILKNENLPAHVTLPCSSKIEHKLAYVNMSDDKKQQYDKYLKSLRDRQYEISVAKLENLQKGLKRGRIEGEKRGIEEGRELERQKFEEERELERQRVEEKNRNKTIKLISKLLNQGHADSSIKEMINSDEEYADSDLDNMINFVKEEMEQPAAKKIRHG